MEMEDNEDELIRLCHKLFLEGRDKDFDYSKIDNNSDYDDIKVIEQDNEDKYFDSEPPSTTSTDTGILDF
jgi:hypothetical protein